MSLARKIFANTSVQIFGKVIMALISIVILKIITNYLSVADYGEYSVIYDYLTFFAIAADLGLFTIAVREMSRDELSIEKISGNILTIRLFLAVMLLGIGIGSTFIIPKYSGTRVPLGVMIAALVALFNLLHGTLSSVLQVKLKMHFAAFSMVVGKIIALAYMVYTAFFAFTETPEAGFFHLLWAGVIGNAVMFLLTLIFVRRFTKIRLRFDREIMKDLFVKALPYGLALVLNMIYFRINTVMLYFLKDETEVGIYAVATRTIETISVIPLFFMNSVLPVLTKKIEEKSQAYRPIIQHSFDVMMMLSLPLVAGGVILAKPIIQLISSQDFVSRIGFFGSDLAFQIILFAILFSYLNILFSFVLISVNRQAMLLITSSAAVLVNVLVNFLTIPWLGFRGAAATSVLSELVVLIGTVILSRRYLDYSIAYTRLVKCIGAALFMAGVIYLLQPYIHVLPLIAIGGIVYFALLYAMKVITREMLQELFMKKPSPDFQQEL